MQDNIKDIEKQIEKNRIDAQAVRRQAETERGKATQYNSPDQEGNRAYHTQQAQQLDERASKLDAEASALEPRRAEVAARIADLKAQREVINREALDKTMAIDNELTRLQGSMII